MIEFEKLLNEQQLAAVQAEPGPFLVIAGAGSGKTRTLTHRVAWLVQNGVPPDRILLLTFTNKAAREMLMRVGSLLPLDVSKIWGGTFHSVANRILRRHAALVGHQSDYTILDREDSADLIKACIPEAGIDPKEKRFPKPDVLIEIYGLSANTGQPVVDIVRRQFEWFEEQVGQILDVQKLYDERKKAVHGMDYDDLLSHLLSLLEKQSEILELYSRQFMAILVDEYQDTNRIQSDIVDRLASRYKNLMVVGDDAQSIYSWRGANFRNIMEFPKRYPGARVFKIEQNYRSTPQILALANEAISANQDQFEKVLRSTRKDGIKPRVISVFNPSEQASFVAGQMLELRDQGMELNDMAVLYRSHFHSMELQMEMTRRNIPFVITSGLRFFEQAHIKDVAAWLKLAANPPDEIAFKRIVLSFPKVGPATAGKIWNKVRSQPLDYVPATKDVPKPARKEWDQMLDTLRILREPGSLESPAKMIRKVMDAGYDEQLKTRFDNYNSRKEDLEQLAAYATRFKRTDEFLAELALMSHAETDDANPGAHDEERVRLSTVHQAKGQEFKVVFVIWLTEGSFPNHRAAETDAGAEEERRLFYVAVTRAMDELYLVYPQIRLGGYGDAFQTPSRFLGEISKKHFEKHEIESSAWRD